MNKVTDLARAGIGQQWKDQEGVLWEVYDIAKITNERIRKIVFFSVPENRRTTFTRVDKTAFSFEPGWERVPQQL